MATGMEIMVGTVLKAVGLDKDVALKKAQEIYIEAESRLKKVESDQAVMMASVLRTEAIATENNALLKQLLERK